MEGSRILVAVLNWGLGHATRCIPIINKLIERNHYPVLASDGEALLLLRKEFPNLEWVELTSYNIRYSKRPFLLKLKLLRGLPHYIKAFKKEHELIQTLLKDRNISGIISDNRWGAYSKLVPSVIITHQVNVLSGITSYFSSKIQQRFINNFDECWVPDLNGERNLSGILGHPKNLKTPLRYIGLLSRFNNTTAIKKYDVCVVLSGPEPQRSILEKKIINELLHSKFRILLVRGKVEESQILEYDNNFTIYNYFESDNLNDAINSSEFVICRSGYTSLLDLAKLQKRALLIPTPGQDEQEYLAKRMVELKFASSCLQQNFSLLILENAFLNNNKFEIETHLDLDRVFTLFKSK